MWEFLFDRFEVSVSDSASWTLISSSDSLGWGLTGGDWLVEVDDAMLLLFFASDAAYERARPNCADAARRAAVDGFSALNAECSPPIINDGIDAVAVLIGLK